MANDQPNGTSRDDDLRLQVSSEDLLLDIDPNVPLEFLKKAQALSGKLPPRKAPRDLLVETHNSHVQKQLGRPKATNLVKKPILALAYPASYKPMAELEKMRLSELAVETHHEGKILILRTITPPYQGAGTVVIVEDEHGDADKMGIYNQSDRSILSIIPEGSVIAVKEPYYKYNGQDDYMICVDHPSDIIYLKFDDPIIPEKFQLGEGETDTAADWKSAGDKAFLTKSYPISVLCYSRALETDDTGDAAFRTDLFAKRAGANLIMKRYDNAISDAKEAMTGKESDWKLYFTAGRAAYALGDFERSKECYELSLKAKPENAAVQQELEKCDERLKEQAEGVYDFRAMARSITAKNIHLDNASFLGNVRIGESPVHGRGLFATKDIKAGEMVFCEKALCVPNEFNLDHNSAALFANLVRTCHDNPSLHAKVLDLYGGSYVRSGHESDIVDGVPVVDVFLLESIRRKNCFSGPRISDAMWQRRWSARREGMCRGLWITAAYANHSCVPNTNRSFIGDFLISTATMDIPAGTEITHIYVAPRAIYSLRKQQFRNWGFNCHCKLCSAEEQSAAENQERRMKMLGELELILRKKKPTVFQPDAAIRPIEKLGRQLEALHEDDVYVDIPKLPLVWPSMWLLQAYYTRKNYNKTVRWAHQALRAFGHIPVVSEDGKVKSYREGTRGVTTFEVVKALKFASDAYEALGEEGLAEEYVEAARIGYKTLSGFDDHFPHVRANPSSWV
ncbi:TPR domain-containing protein [Scedosporium apiospermum]|uniref:TPR domain-containing protein n=1 Tax=Pseudallescheria apiosperma TaxID=563466 RepID=A0A084GGA5_PSEDA|nr:TPR domain-containing protein [Scedosporium apiospermum]KEZ46367.1 TPR domain-containing protein [Scedosporium apiospermum]